MSWYADSLAAAAAAELSQLAGRRECGYVSDDSLGVDDLRQILKPSSDDSNNKDATSSDNRSTRSGNAGAARRRLRLRRRFDPNKFDAAFEKAFSLLTLSPDAYGVEYMSDGRLRATIARIPLSCHARKILLRYWYYVIGILAISYTATYAWIRRRLLRAREARIQAACDDVRDILYNQYNEWAQSGGAHGVDKAVPDTQLRDEVLGVSREAVALWKEVEKRLARDTRLRKNDVVTKNGYPTYPWEWQGRAGRRASADFSSRARSLWGHDTAASRHSPAPPAPAPPQAPWMRVVSRARDWAWRR